MNANSWILGVKEFRVLRDFTWSPSGLCLLAGPNGAGKTTTLDALFFLRNLYLAGHESALERVRGDYFRNTNASEELPVQFDFEVGEIKWRLRFPVSTGGLRGTYGEELWRKGEPVFKMSMFEDQWTLGDESLPLDDWRCCARVLWDRGDSQWLKPLHEVLSNMRIYESFWLNKVRNPDDSTIRDTFLHGTGKNLWSVLGNWKGSSIRYAGQFDWVMSELRKAFPGITGTIEFDRKMPFLYPPGAVDPADGLPPSRASDGLLTGLLQLVAVAGAPVNSIVAFDEVENHLHPHAIRSIVEAMRSEAVKKNLTIILTTHSPVVMNEFKGRESDFFVFGGLENRSTPESLDKLCGQQWLAHFALGDLYDREQFGSPSIGAEG